MRQCVSEMTNTIVKKIDLSTLEPEKNYTMAKQTNKNRPKLYQQQAVVQILPKKNIIKFVT